MNNQIVIKYSNKELYLELYENTSVALSKNFFVPGSHDLIKSDISETISIPKSRQNNITLQNLGHKGATNSIILVNKFADLIIEGVVLMRDCSCFITDAGKDYEVVLKKGTGQLFDVFENYKITDLDLSDYEEIFNLTNVIAANSNTEGIIYPVANFGVQINNYFDIKTIFPAVFLHTIIEKLFSDKNPSINANWTLSGDILTDNDYLNKIVYCSTKQADQNIQGLAVATRFYNPTGGTPIIISPQLPEYKILTVDYFGLMVSDGATPDHYQYHVPSDGHYNFKISVTYAVVNVNYDEFVLSCAIGSAANPFAEIVSSDISGAGTLELICETDAKKGDIIVPYYSIVGFSGGDEVTMLIESFEVTAATFETTELNLIFPLGINLPDMKQSDFLKEFLSFYNLFCITNYVNREIEFYSFVDIINNIAKGQIYDFTDYIDWSQGFENEFSIELGYKNKFLWSVDSNSQKKEETESGYFLMNDINYAGNSEFIKSNFTLTDFENRYSLQIPYSKLFSKNDDGVIKLDSSLEPKIFDIVKRNFAWVLIQYTENDGTDKTPVTSNIPQCVPVNWDTLKQNYWAEYITALQGSNVPIIKALIPFEIFLNFDRKKPVFVDGYGYFVVCEITGWQNNKLCDVKLLKLY